MTRLDDFKKGLSIGAAKPYPRTVCPFVSPNKRSTFVNSDDMGLGDTADLGAAPAEVGLEEPAMDVNVPAAAGPEEEPLGRNPVEV